MVAPSQDRRKAFKVALAYAGTTARAFATEQGISEGHLYQTLRGRESMRLTAIIDAFIAEHTPRVQVAA